MVAGRAAAMPAGPPEPRVIDGSKYLFIAAKTGRRHEFDFSGAGVDGDLLRFFVTVFDMVAGPLGTARSWQAAQGHALALKALMRNVSRLTPIPTSPAAIPRSAFMETRLQIGPRAYDSLRSALRRRSADFSPEVEELLHVRASKRPADGEISGLSPTEFARVIDAARSDVRAARDRVLPNIVTLERWRDGHEFGGTEARRLIVLDKILKRGDVPRYPSGSADLRVLRAAGFANGTEALGSIFLTAYDAVAFGILLATLTGHNITTLESMTTPLHHSGHTHDAVDDAIVSDALKPRRGKSRAAMTVTAHKGRGADAGVPGQGNDLRDAHNVFALLERLTAPARVVSGEDHLFSWVSLQQSQAGGPRRFVRSTVYQGTKVRPQSWAKGHGLRADDGTPLELSFRRIRLTYVSMRDEPIAHSRKTLHETYQARNTRELERYQRLVAGVLDEQVQLARSTHQTAFLNEQDYARLRTDTPAAARSLGVPVRIAERILTGELDTAFSACADNDHGPHNDGPCRASFLLCAGCPCAVALPSHWPVIAATHRQLFEQRSNLTELEWARRFGQAHARLTQLVEQMPEGAYDRALAQVTADQASLVTRLVSGKEHL